MGTTKAIENGLIVTMDDEHTIIEEGYVLLEDNRIAEIGPGDCDADADEQIDASDCVIMPGFVTAHTHLYGILLRGATLDIEPPGDFAQVLQRVWWPLDEALTLDDAYASGLSASAELLKSGSTFLADTYSGPNSIEGSLDRIADATNSIGIRALLAFEMTERHTEKEATRGLEENIRFAKECDTCQNLASLMVSIHASFTVSDQLIEDSATKAAELEVPLTIHTSEGAVDLYHNLEKYGERTVERLHRLGALGKGTALAHCVHVDDNELDLIAETKSSVAHNPMSNMLNAVGTAPVPEMLSRGITVGLGNDGWIYDPFENMRCAYTVHKLSHRNPSMVSPLQVLRMATIDAACCYGLEDAMGSLEVGKLADLIIIDGESAPTPLTPDSVIGHILNTFSGRDVRDTVVDGNLVVRKGRLTRIDESEVAKISSEAARDLWARMKET
ncbi:amidohydrolase [Candidatus Thorarchaeota archaeon]|nr:MAG: amidohydrolase [Candidatus Thorarchaeota archaeon]